MEKYTLSEWIKAYSLEYDLSKIAIEDLRKVFRVSKIQRGKK